MEAWVPSGFNENLDSPAARLVVQALIDRGVPAPTWTTNAPITARTQRGYETRLRAWFKSVALTEDEILNLEHEERCMVVEAFLAEKSATVSSSVVHSYRCAIQWWAGEHNIASPVTDVARAIQGHGKARGKAQVLTSQELTCLIAGLKKCEVATGKYISIETRIGWHLRTRAAILVTIACSLRIKSELPHLKEGNVLKVDSNGIHLRIAETKTKVHRDVVIRPRSDELCPIAAIREFHKWLSKHNLKPPAGLLLPSVNLHRTVEAPDVLTVHSREDDWWRIAVRYLRSQGFDMDKKTLHGLRAMAITEAVNSGWSHTELRDLGGWASLNSAARYARNTGSGIDLYGSGA